MFSVPVKPFHPQRLLRMNLLLVNPATSMFRIMHLQKPRDGQRGAKMMTTTVGDLFKGRGSVRLLSSRT
jgi:hypothetical protein